MPLLDHFQPPLSDRRHGHAFPNSWATYLSSQLNSRLPDGYFAEANVQFGLEIDVAAFADGPTGPAAVGQSLPTLPLWLRGGLCLPVELQATYERTCVEQRVPTAA